MNTMKDTQETLSTNKCLTIYQWYICTQNNFTATNYPKKRTNWHYTSFGVSKLLQNVSSNYAKTMIYHNS